MLDGTPITVLVVDDDAFIVSSLSRLLRREGFVVESATNGRDALDKACQVAPDVVMSDVHMPGMNGFTVAERCDALESHVPVVLMTGDEALAAPVPASQPGVFDFVRKPISSTDALVRVLKNAAQQYRLKQRASALERQLAAQGRLGDLVGTSAPMQSLYRFIGSAAPTESTVLVTGESGTGKELVARALHARSRRADKPFVCVNCAAIPPELVESELFGHAKGAFTGAASDRIGLFRSADGGTLFLDEVGDLPLAVQAHLLRALQQGEVKSVGSDVVRKVDVRVIAATNVDLPAKVKDGRFRSDLYYRLNVISTQLPPLRERGDDVLLLADRILARLAARFETTPKVLSSGARAALVRHAWPGNVRELENALERAVVLARGHTIEETDLPVTTTATVIREMPVRSFTPLGLYELPFSEAKRQWLERFETRYVQKALERSAGNVAEAARRANLDRSNFRRIVRKLRDGNDKGEHAATTTDDTKEPKPNDK